MITACSWNQSIRKSVTIITAVAGMYTHLMTCQPEMTAVPVDTSSKNTSQVIPNDSAYNKLTSLQCAILQSYSWPSLYPLLALSNCVFIRAQHRHSNSQILRVSQLSHSAVQPSDTNIASWRTRNTFLSSFMFYLRPPEANTESGRLQRQTPRVSFRGWRTLERETSADGDTTCSFADKQSPAVTQSRRQTVRSVSVLSLSSPQLRYSRPLLACHWTTLPRARMCVLCRCKSPHNSTSILAPTCNTAARREIMNMFRARTKSIQHYATAIQFSE